MPLPQITYVNPHLTPWARWAGSLAEELASYNVPNPGAEDLWVQWAETFCAIPELSEVGLAEPRGFRTWQDWATFTSQVLT